MQEALQLSQQKAILKNHNEFDNIHFLLALISQEDTKFNTMIKKLGVDIEKLKIEAEKLLEQYPTVSNPNDIQISREFYKTLIFMQEIADKRGDEFVRGELFIPAIFKHENKIKSLPVKP